MGVAFESALVHTRTWDRACRGGIASWTSRYRGRVLRPAAACKLVPRQKYACVLEVGLEITFGSNPSCILSFFVWVLVAAGRSL